MNNKVVSRSVRRVRETTEMSRRAERLTVRARSERPCLRAVLRREDEADDAEVVFHVDGCFDVGELDLCVDLARDFKLGTDIEDSVMI
jgi:hypothetical protein